VPPNPAGSFGAAPAATQGYAAEDQTPAGRFTTAAEVKQILTATRPNWIALRDYGGQDLLYFTQLLSWRCGLHEIRYAINGGAPQVFPAEPCYSDTASPNAIRAEAQQPYLALEAGSVETVEIELLYDDLTTDSASFDRAAILMP
jgi:hypothetical protein